MNIRTAVSWVLIIFALGITFNMVVLPALKRPVAETIPISELAPTVLKNASGEDVYYYRFKALDWMEILRQLAPVLTAFLGYITNLKKEK